MDDTCRSEKKKWNDNDHQHIYTKVKHDMRET